MQVGCLTIFGPLKQLTGNLFCATPSTQRPIQVGQVIQNINIVGLDLKGQFPRPGCRFFILQFFSEELSKLASNFVAMLTRTNKCLRVCIAGL